MGQSASALQLLRSGLPEDQLLSRLENNVVDLGAKDEEERGALHWSAASGYAKLASALLERGVDANLRDINGDTALHTAAFKNQPEVMRILIKGKADINLTDSSGMTALHWAVRENNAECVDILVAADADLSIRNDRDQTPVDLAATLKRKAREDIVSRLRKHSAFKQVVAATSQSMSNPPSRLPMKLPTNSDSSTDNAMPSDFHRRLMALCSLWGLVKYSHPFVAYRAEIDWDKALLETLPLILEKRKSGAHLSEAEFSQILSSLLAQLHDPNTRLVSNADELAREQSAPIDDVSDRPQPYVEFTKDKVALVVTTDYDQFATADADSKLDQLVNAFSSAAASGCAIIFDARHLQKVTSGEMIKGAQQLGFIFSEAFRCFLSDDLPLPTLRQRLFTGLPEHRRTFSSAFQHGFFVQDAEILHRSSDSPISLAQLSHPQHPSHSPVGQKPLCFLVSRHTPQPILDIAIAMRSRGQAVFVYQADESDYKVKKPTSTTNTASLEYLVYEPYISASVFHVPGTDGIRVLVRQNERVSPDGTVGFHPDSVVIPGARSNSQNGPPPSPVSSKSGAVSPSSSVVSETDAAIRIGVEFCTGRRPVPRQRLVYPNFSVRRVEDDFKAFGSCPTPELRLLSLFRIWNAVQYFFPYKHIMDVHWDDVLLSNIDRFVLADTALEYHIAVAEVIKELSDTHAFVRSSVLSSHIGVAVPPVRVTALASGVTAVSQVSPHIKDSVNIKQGDILESIDGVSVEQRREILSKLFAASTPQAMLWRTDMKLLAGGLNSKATLVLRRVGSSESWSVEVERTLQTPLSASNDSLLPYQILPRLDKTGKPIGWVDLTRLSFAESDTALQSVAQCASVIIDLRGYTKGTVYRIGPLLASSSTQVAIYETPAMMPTLLSDDLQPPSLRSVQTCVVPRPDSPISQSCKIVALINEDTLSHGEYAATFLKAVRPDITFVGSPTNGALGNITNLVVPGGIQVGFSGMGMTGADGTPLQRRGIAPDVVVQPSAESLASGVDAVLEKAIEFLSAP